jgi:transposase-like protein
MREVARYSEAFKLRLVEDAADGKWTLPRLVDSVKQLALS